jgi:hypothetical protein
MSSLGLPSVVTTCSVRPLLSIIKIIHLCYREITFEEQVVTDMTRFEEGLMRAMGLKTVEELDELLAQPISQYAADHSEPPDEEYELADRMYQEADRQWDARERFNALTESKFLN